MSEMAVVLRVGLLVLLPQLAGWIATRAVRRPSWTVWPAAAIAVFGFVFYWWLWAPAREVAARMDSRCGMWALALGFVLVTGLVGHLGLGALFARLARRRRDHRDRPRA